MTTPKSGPFGVMTAVGDMLFGDAAGQVERISIGAPGEVLTNVGGIPVMAARSLVVDVFQFYTASDALFGAINGQTGIASPGIRNLRSILKFIDTAAAPADNENAVFMGVLPVHYDIAKQLSVVIDWVAPPGIVAGDVKWSAAFENLIGQDVDASGFGAPKTVAAITSVASGVLTRTFLTFTAAEHGLLGGDPYRLQLVRDANAATDTLVGDADVLRVSVAEV